MSSPPDRDLGVQGCIVLKQGRRMDVIDHGEGSTEIVATENICLPTNSARTFRYDRGRFAL